MRAWVSAKSKRIGISSMLYSLIVSTAHGVCLLRSFILIELEFDGIDQGEPTGFDDIFADADRAPNVLVVGRFDDHADAGGSPGFTVNDTHFVVDQPHMAQTGKVAV